MRCTVLMGVVLVVSASSFAGCAPAVAHVLIVQTPPTYSITCRSRASCHLRAGELCPAGFQVNDASGDTRGHTTSTGQYWESTDHTILITCGTSESQAAPTPAATAPSSAAQPAETEPAPSAPLAPPAAPGVGGVAKAAEPAPSAPAPGAPSASGAAGAMGAAAAPPSTPSPAPTAP